MSRKQQFRLYITLFCTFLCRLFTTTTLKCLISRLMENVNKKRRNFIFLLEPGCGPLEFNFKRILLQSKWVEIIAIKNERTQIHFLQRRSRCCCVAGSRTMHYACFQSENSRSCLYSKENHNKVACQNRRFMHNRFDN